MPTRLLPEGLYEQLVTTALRAEIEHARASGLTISQEPVDGPLLLSLLTRHLARELGLHLASSAAPLETTASLQSHLASSLDDRVDSPAAMLRAVTRNPDPLPITSTPLSLSALLTGALDEPRLGLELERELASSDRVDALVSFVTWDGWRRLSPALEALSRRGGTLRLITTTYTGATDADAVAAIARLPGAAVRLSYDGRRTRLHAKAWLFHRHSGFTTAWVGSANLSGAALSGGLEWTVKASKIDVPHIVEKFAGTFETLWNDAEFESFDPASDLPRLGAALDRERGRVTPASEIHFFATLSPFPFQEEILEHLQSERLLHGRFRNLVVAATGTGKTLIAAFDYLRQVPSSGIRPRLLFVAHREELLQQSLEAFRHVLRDASFGERLGGGFEPRSHDFLFTTVQSFASRKLAERLPPDHWDLVVIDECHHSTAETYSQVVERLSPKWLLGLTATPERADGVDILPHFGGRIAAEVRLWHALDRQLLAPFDYYGLADGIDLRDVGWQRGGYASNELSSLYTGNDRRAELVIEQFRRHRGNVRDARALGFCVSVEHAHFMTRKFQAAGIPAIAVHGGSTSDERGAAPALLQRRDVNVVFTCELYNEGVDLPFVDTLLFLRPTSSPTVFLQQLGRGLRLHPGKSSCLVLDFIGQCRREFRFDRLMTALTGIPRGRLTGAVEQGFPTLPSGCSMRLDAVSRDVVLANLRETVQGGERRLARELATHAQARGGEISLAQFLEDSGRSLEDVYAANGFTSLRAAAGLDATPLNEAERALAKKLKLLLHTDDPGQLEVMVKLADGAVAESFHGDERRRLQMLGYQLWHEPADRFGPDEVLSRWSKAPRLRRELRDLAAVLTEAVELAPTAVVPLGWTLQLHRSYERREVMAAIGAWTHDKKPPTREGVFRLGDDELFFVTLVKDEKRFSPTTRYRDYAISPTLFHWQSQSGTTADGDVGRRYRENGARFWLLVRRTDAEAFRFLGAVRCVGSEGSKPMSITWRLERAMPAGTFQEFASLVAA